MRLLIRTGLVIATLLVPAAGVASAVTLDDLVNLKANGLGDEILVALIQTDGSVFRLSPADVVAAHKRGLSDTVILAMVMTARPAMPAPTDAPAVLADADPSAVPANIGADFSATDSSPSVQPTVIEQIQRAPVETRTIEVPVVVAVPVFVRPPEPPKPAPPVFWGFGGKQRPDSWRLPADTTASDPAAKKP